MLGKNWIYIVGVKKKSSSTEMSTTSDSDWDAVLTIGTAVSSAFRYHLGKLYRGFGDFFDCRTHPLGLEDYRHLYSEIPTAGTVQWFVDRICSAANLGSGVSVTALVLLDRVIDRTQFAPESTTWQWLLIGCYLIAAKTMQDVHARDFVAVCRGCTVERLLSLERALLVLINFDVDVTQELYDYYVKSLASLK